MGLLTKQRDGSFVTSPDITKKTVPPLLPLLVNGNISYEVIVVLALAIELEGDLTDDDLVVVHLHDGTLGAAIAGGEGIIDGLGD